MQLLRNTLSKKMSLQVCTAHHGMEHEVQCTVFMTEIWYGRQMYGGDLGGISSLEKPELFDRSSVQHRRAPEAVRRQSV
jgi:hypothetical protein